MRGILFIALFIKLLRTESTSSESTTFDLESTLLEMNLTEQRILPINETFINITAQQEQPVINTTEGPRKKRKEKKRKLEDATATDAKNRWREKMNIGLKTEDMVRPYNFTYPYLFNNGTQVTEELIRQDLQYYSDLIFSNQAGNDTYTYPWLKGTDFENPSIRAMYFYRTYKLSDYRIDFPNPQFYKIIMKVDPCRNRGDNDLCCDGNNEAVCEDFPFISGGEDVAVAWFMSGYVVQCSALFDEKGTCGTYIEIHKPNNQTVLEEKQIKKRISSGLTTEFVSTKNICAGRYEFWLVVRTRNGSILQHVKPFYSEYPSCEKVIDNSTTSDNTTYVDTSAKKVYTDDQVFNFTWTYVKTGS